MAPKPKRVRRTPEQQAQDLQLKARDTIARAGRKELEGIMVAFPESVSEFLRVAAEKGWRGDKPEPKLLEKKENDGGLSTFLSDAYYKVKSMSAGPICGLLSVGEPVACSRNSLKGLVTVGNRVPGKQVVLELFEFMFGHNAEWSATGNLREVEKLHAYLRDRNLERGRRCRDMVFPLDWRRDGLYELSKRDIDGDSYLAALHRFSRLVVVFNSEDLCNANMDEVYVKDNYSETTAALVCDACPKLHRVLLLDFPIQCVARAPPADISSHARPPAQKCARRFSLDDVGLESPPPKLAALADGILSLPSVGTPSHAGRPRRSRSPPSRPRPTRASGSVAGSSAASTMALGESATTPVKVAEAKLVPPAPASSAKEADALVEAAAGGNDILPSVGVPPHEEGVLEDHPSGEGADPDDAENEAADGSGCDSEGEGEGPADTGQ